MTSLLEFKSKVQSLYQRYSIYIKPVFKFIIAILVFVFINSNLGYDERLKSVPIVLALSLVCAFSPLGISALLVIIVTTLHVFYVSPILAAIMLITLLIMYFIYIHFIPELGFVLIAIPILYAINIPYIIPILLGLFFTPISIVASAFGILIVYLLKIIVEVINMQFGNTIEDSLLIFTYVMEALINNQEIIMTIIIFALIILLTYITRTQKFDFAHEASIGVGALTCIIGFLFADLRLGITEHIWPMILGTLFSGAIALVILFFHRILDYSRSEHVQFEDDDYYYYVKAVPKIEVAEQKFNIKRINPQRKNNKKDSIHADDDDYLDEDFFDDNFDKNNDDDSFFEDYDE